MKSTIFKALTLTVALTGLNTFATAPDLATRQATWDKLAQDVLDAAKRDRNVAAQWAKKSPIVKNAGIWATVVSAAKAGVAVSGAAISAPYIFGKKLVLDPKATWKKHGAVSTVMMGVGATYCGYLACKALHAGYKSVSNWFKRPASE